MGKATKKADKRQVKKSPARSTLGVINVKLSRSARRCMEQNARRFARGNLSAWVRHAARVHTPKKGEKVSLKAA